MGSETPASPPVEALTDPTEAEARSAYRLRRWVEFLSAVLLALATIATAWSAYQAARWGGEQTRHASSAVVAIVRTAKFTNLAEQRSGQHLSMFTQWATAFGAGNMALADFLFERFPEPLKAASVAWRATQPLTSPSAPSTPFEMPNYVLAETVEAQRWEDNSIAESEAAARAGDIADRYLLFTVVFASVLFFGGISGKFDWQALDVGVLVLGAVALTIGLVVLFLLPIQ